MDDALKQINQLIQQVANEREALLSNRDLVLATIKTIEETEKVNDAVLEWLNDANKLINEMKKWDPFEKILEQYDKIKTMNNKYCNFKSFSSPIPSLEYFSSPNFVCLNSTKLASDQLLEALKDDRSRIIGLYGSQGSGKTTLVKAVGEKAKYLKIFDTVLFVTLCENAIKIRKQLAKSLNLRLDKNVELENTSKLLSTLESMDSVLVILDDVMEKLELGNICIPCNGNRCKILLTTRYQQVCTSMNCQREIPLLPLSKEDSWILLKKYSGIVDESSSNLLEVAQKVALECKGLPETIKKMGSSLKNKGIKEWTASLNCLRHTTARYQVFLSFRGKDTRYAFTGFLYRHLCRKKFKTFIDEDGLEGGNQISQDLIETINASRLSIIVLSKNYAYSSWCLDELVTILECKKKHHQEVLPIFYKTEPSDVRHQKNTYAEAMVKHTNTFGKNSEKVKRWRSALSEVADLSGMHYSTGYEYEFIKKIVKKVKKMKNRLYIQSMD